MKLYLSHPAIPIRLRLVHIHPRVDRRVLPSQARPSLFGSD